MTRSAPVGVGGPLKPLQRFVCNSCGRSFTAERQTAEQGRRFSNDVVDLAVRSYFETLSSYRSLARQLEGRLGRTVSPITLNEWVLTTATAAMTPLEMSALCQPAWSGVLVIDGKSIWAAGTQGCLLVAVDHGTQDIVHSLVLDRQENEAGFEQLVREAITVAGYPLKVLVTDGADVFRDAWSLYFSGGADLQICRIHQSRRYATQIPKVMRSPTAPLRDELRHRLRGVLFAPTLDQARHRYWELSADARRYDGLVDYDPIAALGSKFNLFMTHHDHDDVPADNNVVENVIKHLGKRLRLMEGFATFTNAELYSRLLIAHYRFKQFSCCTDPARNGKSPLQLAGVDTDGLDWLRFTTRRQQHTT